MHTIGTDIAFEHQSAVLVKIWSIHIEEDFPVLLLWILVGWLTSCDRLHTLVTALSFFLSEQVEENHSGHPTDTFHYCYVKLCPASYMCY